MTETSIIASVLSLGVGGVLGIVIFFMYRYDRKGSEHRLSKIIEADQQTREKHTSALVELITLLKRMNGKGV